MSDNELENDLFGGSDDEAPPKPPSPTASSSRGSPKPEHSGTATPAVNNEEDDGIGADLACVILAIRVWDSKLTLQFGDEDEDQPASPRRREGTSPDTPVSLRSSRSPNPLEYAEEDVREPEEQQQTWVSMPFPTWDGLKPTDGKVSPSRIHLRSLSLTNIRCRSGNCVYRLMSTWNLHHMTPICFVPA